MSTVLTGQPPTRTLPRLRLVRDVRGEEMHKSRGNAIWFDDAAEEIEADAMRWLLCRRQPGSKRELRLWPGAEVVRRFLLPWNTYSFFVMYARLDGWTPAPGSGPPDAAAGDPANTSPDGPLDHLDGLVADVQDGLDRV